MIHLLLALLFDFFTFDLSIFEMLGSHIKMSEGSMLGYELRQS